MQFDGVCNTYEVYSCNVNVPLRTSEMVLITVQGQPDGSDKYVILRYSKVANCCHSHQQYPFTIVHYCGNRLLDVS